MSIATGGALLNIANGIREFARATPGATAVVDGDRQLTFAALHERSSQLANALLSAGLRPRERVAILMSNRMEYIEVACGLAKSGLTIVPINTRQTTTEIDYILGHSSARAIVLENQFAGAAAGALQSQGITTVLSIGGNEAGPDYEETISSARAEDPKITLPEVEPFMINYTSGTTGRPKGVMLSHRCRCLTFYCAALEWGLGPGRRTIAVAPMHFGGGFTFGYGAPSTGATLAILPAFDPERLLALIDRVRAQSMYLVPTHGQMIRMLGHETIRKYDVSSLETLFFAAAPMPQDLKEWLLETWPHVGTHEHYGSTEAGVVSDLRPPDLLRKPRSVGVPWFMTEVRVVDDAGDPIGPGGTGELFSRSPFLMNGYLNDQAATEACTTTDGFLTSGDVARLDDEGYLYIVDRKKDMIITGGANVYTLEVEEVLRAHPSVLDAAVLGLPDEVYGERVTAVVILMRGHTLKPGALEAHCRASLSNYKVPRRFEAIDVFPRNASGKVLKRELRERYATTASRTNGR